METVYILATSKNIDTIKSRHEFLLATIDTFKQGQSNSQYSAYIQQAVDNYKKAYYDRPPQEYQLAILSNSNSFDLHNFYCNSLVNAMKRFCGEQTEEINAMKKETAKTKRAGKVLETIKTTKNEFHFAAYFTSGQPVPRIGITPAYQGL